MSEHTPGPWLCFMPVGAGNAIRIASGAGQTIAYVEARPRDAALIAAAPELLEALQVLLKRSVIEEGWSGSDPIFEQASLAIAKALKVSR